MRKVTHHRWFLWSLTLSLLVAAGCEKRRGTKFAQGEGEYLFAISDFQGKRFTLTTGEAVTPGIASKADELVLDENNEVIRDLPSVRFEADGKIVQLSNERLNNFDFYGRENHKYTLEYRLTEDYLVVFKVASRRDLPSFELTSALNQSGDEYAVPILGFPLKKYAIERVEDSRGKSTDRKRAFAKEFLRDATHFRIDDSAVKYFDGSSKVDLFPVEFFNSEREWFYEITLVDRPLYLPAGANQNNWFQYELGMQYGSGRIKFYRTNNSIIGVDVNIPDEAVTLEGIKLPKVVEIPAQWVDYRLVTSGKDAYLKEEVLKDFQSGAQDWESRNFGLLDFRGVNALGAANLNNIKLQRLDVNDEYLSFTVFDSNTGLTLRYSFVSSDLNVPGQQYPIEDMSRFGFFGSQKRVYSGALTQSEEVIQQGLFLNRMYDENNEIVFYLTDNSPGDELYMDAVQRAVDAWDAAFLEASIGTKYENNPIRVRFNRDKRVKNGDVRYHKVSFYGYDIESRLLGYGPSVTDNRTGQIYSSTNHIYLRNYREGILRNLVTFARQQMGLFDDKFVDGIEFPNQVLPVAGAPSFDDLYPGADVGFFAHLPNQSRPAYFSKAAELIAEGGRHQIADAFADYQQDLIALATQAELSQARNTSTLPLPSVLDSRRQAQNTVDFLNYRQGQLSANVDKALARTAQEYRTCEFHEAGIRNSFDEIKDFCMREGTLFKSYIDELVSAHQQNSNVFRLHNEVEAFHECAQKLMKPTLISTLVHEFGHNFGMTHNFMGSSDYRNFRFDENGVPVVRSTSVMDYAHRDGDRGIELGTYDVAAIRYAYYQAVEVVEGDNITIVDVARPFDDVSDISEVLRRRGFDPNDRREYSYCWDRDIMTGEMPQVHPECRRWDQGSNPIQSVLSFMDDFNTFMVTSGYRFDSIGIMTPSGAAGNVLQRQLQPMKAFHDHYRSMLRTHPGSPLRDDPYFFANDLGETHFNSVISSIIDEASLPYYVAISEDYARRMEAQGKTELFAAISHITDARERSLALEKIVMNEMTEIQRYKLAADLSFKFMKELLFSNIQYCAVQYDNPNSAPQFVPFEQFRSDHYYRTNGLETVNSCLEARDAIQRDPFFGQFGTITSIDTVGNRISSVLHSPDTQALQVKSPISVGFEISRFAASLVLADRSPGLGIAAQQNFRPNFIDNPVYRRILADEFQKRFVVGVDPNRMLRNNSQKLSPIVRFYEEQTLFSDAWSLFLSGLNVPGQEAVARARQYLPNMLPPGAFLGGISADAVVINDARGNTYWAGSNLPFVRSIMEVYAQLNEDLFSANTINPDSFLVEANRNAAINQILQVVNTGLAVEGQQTVGPTNIIYGNYVAALSVLQEYYGLVPPARLASVCSASLAAEGIVLGEEDDLRCAPELVRNLAAVVADLGLTQEAQRIVLGSVEVMTAQRWPTSSLSSLRSGVLSYVRVSYPNFAGNPEVYTEDDILGFISQNFRTNGLFRATAMDTYQELRTKIQTVIAEDDEVDLTDLLTSTANRIFDEKLEGARQVLANKDQYEAKDRILRSVIGIR